MPPTIAILAPGPLATVQDLGRPAAVRYGVPRGGAMDPFALAAANLLVGNPPGAAALELSAGGVALRLLRPCTIALAGADLAARLDGRPMPGWCSLSASAGQLLELPGRGQAWGARAYLALAGGLAAPEVLGSRATELGAGFGGHLGRRLAPGDTLAAGEPPDQLLPALGRRWPEQARPAYGPRPTLRLLPGPHLACLADDALARLCAAALRLSPNSNRMGYRLEGLELAYAGPCSLPSLGVLPGVIQVPPDGRPILLMADAQTTGGYPIAAVLIAADMPLAAQLLPGDELGFALCDEAAALAALRAQRAALAAGPATEEGDILATMAGG